MSPHLRRCSKWRGHEASATHCALELGQPEHLDSSSPAQEAGEANGTTRHRLFQRFPAAPPAAGAAVLPRGALGCPAARTRRRGRRVAAPNEVRRPEGRAEGERASASEGVEKTASRFAAMARRQPAALASWPRRGLQRSQRGDSGRSPFSPNAPRESWPGTQISSGSTMSDRRLDALKKTHGKYGSASIRRC